MKNFTQLSLIYLVLFLISFLQINAQNTTDQLQQRQESVASGPNVAATGKLPRHYWQEMTTEEFAGSWRLVSAEGHSTDGSITYDWGQNPLGRVMFDAGGRLSLHLVDPDRPNFESGDFLRPTPEELSKAFNGYFGYFGSYTVDLDKQIVTFHIDGAAYPNYIGSDQLRFYEITGDRLVLRTPPERAGGEDIVYYVTWEREH